MLLVVRLNIIGGNKSLLLKGLNVESVFFAKFLLLIFTLAVCFFHHCKNIAVIFSSLDHSVL